MCRIRDKFRRIDSRQVYAPSSYLHVTVKELGWLGEDVQKEDLPAILDVIEEVASEKAPFDLGVEGVGIFPSVIYGRVRKGAAEIRRMNLELVERLGKRAIQSKYDGQSMLPHVSIAHFTTKDVEPLIEETRRLTARFVGEMRVREIQVKRSYPHRLFEVPHGVSKRGVVNEPLASFRLGKPNSPSAYRRLDLLHRGAECYGEVGTANL